MWRSTDGSDVVWCVASAYLATSLRVFRSPSTADQDGWMRLLYGRWTVHLLGQPRVLAGERTGLAAPRPVGDLQQVLEHLETFLDRREAHAECAVLALVPRRTDAEVRTTGREHIKRGCLLDQDSRVPVRDAGHERPELDPFGGSGKEGEREPALQQRRVPAAQLNEVVPDPDRVEPRLLGPPADIGQVPAHVGRPAGPVELVDLQSELHAVTPAIARRARPPARRRRRTSRPRRPRRSQPRQARPGARRSCPDGRARPRASRAHPAADRAR